MKLCDVVGQLALGIGCERGGVFRRAEPIYLYLLQTIASCSCSRDTFLWLLNVKKVRDHAVIRGTVPHPTRHPPAEASLHLVESSSLCLRGVTSDLFPIVMFYGIIPAELMPVKYINITSQRCLSETTCTQTSHTEEAGQD